MKKHLLTLLFFTAYPCANAIELTKEAMENACKSTVVDSLLYNDGYSFSQEPLVIWRTDQALTNISDFRNDAALSFGKDVLLGSTSLGDFWKEWSSKAWDTLFYGPNADDYYQVWNPNHSFYNNSQDITVSKFVYERDSLRSATYHKLLGSSDLEIHANADDVFGCEDIIGDFLNCVGDYFNIDGIGNNDVTYQWSLTSLDSREQISLMSTGENNVIGFDSSSVRGGAMLVSAATSTDRTGGVNIVYTACDAAAVYTQSAPRIISAGYSVNSRTSVNVEVAATYDASFSKNAINKQPLTYIYKFLHSNPGFSRTVVSDKSSITFSGLVGPEYLIKVEVNDGVFTASKSLGVHVVNPDVTCEGISCSIGGH